MNPFEEAREFLRTREADIKNFYMVNRLLSCMPETCLASHHVNRYIGYLPDWALQSLFRLSFRRINNPYLRYPKKKKKSKDKKLRKKIRSAFIVNDAHADQIIKIFRAIDDEPSKHFGLKEGE